MAIFNKIKKVIVLFVLFQSCNISSTEKQIIKNEDTSSFEIDNSISSSLKDTFLISNFSVNGLELAMSDKNIKKQLLLCDSIYCDSIHFGDGVKFYNVYYQGKIVMSYYSNGSFITWIDVYSPIFHTKNGFRVGDNVKKFIDSTDTDIEIDPRIGQMLILEEKETFWLGLFFDKKYFIHWIGLYDNR
jgi:hypothetical protein